MNDNAWSKIIIYNRHKLDKEIVNIVVLVLFH